jgi:hypothetical protein
MQHLAVVHMPTVRAVLAGFVWTMVLAFAAPMVRSQLNPPHGPSGQVLPAHSPHSVHDAASAPQQPALTSSHAGHAAGDHAAAGPGAPSIEHEIACALCLLIKEPPASEFDASIARAHPLAHALQPLISASIEARAGAPLPPRGPPAA